MLELQAREKRFNDEDRLDLEARLKKVGKRITFYFLARRCCILVFSTQTNLIIVSSFMTTRDILCAGAFET